MNYLLLLPEITLVVTALVVLLADLITKEKRALPVLTVIGLLAALLFAFSMSTIPPEPGAGVPLSIDGFTKLFRYLLIFSTLLVVLASPDYVTRHFRGAASEYYALMLIACASMVVLTAATELITLYVALETSGIALYALSGFLRDRQSSEAGIKYLVLGGVSSAFLLYGMVIFFGITGATYLPDISQAVQATFQVNALPILLGIVLLVAGFGFKLASFPFQMWVPDVYQGAPTPVTAFLSVVSKAAGFAVVLRTFYVMLGAQFAYEHWSYIFAVLAALTMTLGNVVALQQRNIKRMMAYSSVAQAGYLLVGLAVATPSLLGMGSVLLFLVAYAFSNLAAFIAIIAITESTGSDEIAGFAGVARRSPFLAGCLTLAMLSLTGIPPTAGFFAKLVVFGFALQYGLFWLVLVGVINSVISAFYYIGIVKAMYLGTAPEQTEVQVGAGVRVALGIAAILTFVIGVWPDVALNAAFGAIGL